MNYILALNQNIEGNTKITVLEMFKKNHKNWKLRPKNKEIWIGRQCYALKFAQQIEDLARQPIQFF